MRSRRRRAAPAFSDRIVFAQRSVPSRMFWGGARHVQRALPVAASQCVSRVRIGGSDENVMPSSVSACASSRDACPRIARSGASR
jgi:hypothetical protein